ncbi:MAG TPA: CoA-binding protein [Anaerolineae bacterium]|nr:CoA-binding protein [Anaerolineae bacterium]HIQ05684.1 CoA-binding protein [Anaerolineae bacterium]
MSDSVIAGRVDTSLEVFFNPRGVAVIGASRSPNKVSHGLLHNLTTGGYAGPIYPVNPKAEEILGLRCYPDIGSVPDPVELGVIVLPPRLTPTAVEACGQRGLRGVIIISSGFREVGPEGKRLEEAALAAARRYGMRLLGPNCVGTVDTSVNLNATFIRGMPDRGPIAFMSQSGAICGSVVDWARGRGIGFSRFVSLGNQADVNETEVMSHLAEDEHTQVIAAYLEGIRDGNHFMQVASRVSHRKPVIVLKAGRTGAGARAAASHTGALAGAYAAYQAAFRQAGVLETDSIEALFEYAVTLAYQPLPTGNRVAILSNAGGPAVIAADWLASEHLALADLTPETVAHLRSNLAPDAQVKNPVDMLGGADHHDYAQALKALLQDPQVDAVIAILVPQALIDPVAVATAVGEVAGAYAGSKPVLACFVGDASVRAAWPVLHRYHIPPFVFPAAAVRALGAAQRRQAWLSRPVEPPARITDVDAEVVARRIAAWRASGYSQLGEGAVRPLLAAYGIPVVPGEMVHTAEAAAEVATQLGFPVALKLISPDVLHKSEIGGVMLNLDSPDAVRSSYSTLLSRVDGKVPEAHVEGVLVERMAKPGREVIVGMRRDPQFGPLLMFGLGGVYVELIQDVAFRVAPLSRRDAQEMIAETKAGRVLAGLRGQPPADTDQVVDIILRLAQLAQDHPQIAELEINPLVVYDAGQGALALDARATLIHG